MRAADLKIVLRIWEGLRNDRPGGYCEYRQDLVCSDNGVSAMGYILSHSQSLQRRLSSQNIPVFRAIACDGICPDDISRKSQRYRSVSDIPNAEAISHGDIKCRLSINIGRCQRNARLANICRTRPEIDCTGTEAVCGRVSGSRSGQYRLRIGLYDHRSVSVDVSMGELSHCQGGSQTAHSSGHQGSNSKLHSYLRRQIARRKRSGHAYAGSRRLLCYGSGISGLPASLYRASGGELFCNESKKQSGCTQGVFGSSGSEDRGGMRSAYCAEWPLQQTIISGTVAAYQIQSTGNRQDINLVHPVEGYLCEK